MYWLTCYIIHQSIALMYWLMLYCSLIYCIKGLLNALYYSPYIYIYTLIYFSCQNQIYFLPSASICDIELSAIFLGIAPTVESFQSFDSTAVTVAPPSENSNIIALVSKDFPSEDKLGQ